ncbi:MAG: HTTM domain-containing protein [Bdellovibrio sp.]
MRLKTLRKSVDDFFFSPEPVHSVVFLRIAFGILILIQWFSIWDNLQLFWGPEGLVSLETAVIYNSVWRLNLFEFMPNDPAVPVMFAYLLFLGAVGMTVGFFTKTSMVVTFLMLVSFHNRNVFILNSGDIVIRNILFLLLFAPCADAYSFDHWIKHKRGLVAERPLEKSPWALRLIQIQFCIIYVATVMFKMKGNMWADGTAVYTATRLEEFIRAPLEILNNMAALKFLTWSTLAVEFALGTLVWVKELRYWVLLAGVALHLGIEMSMVIPLFEWVMIALMLSMVDARDLEKIGSYIKLFPTIKFGKRRSPLEN